MMKYRLLLIVFSLSFCMCAAQKTQSSPYHFSKPKHAKNIKAKKTDRDDEMRAKQVVVEPQFETENAGAKKVATRRVGVVSNNPKSTDYRVGGSKNLGYNPAVRDATQKGQITTTSPNQEFKGMKPTSSSSQSKQKPHYKETYKAVEAQKGKQKKDK
jgi:hypothetical protein